MPRGFGLYRSNRLAVNEERVVWFAGLESKLAHGDTARGGEIHGIFVLHDPTARGERLVDLFAGYFLGVWHFEYYSNSRGLSRVNRVPGLRWLNLLGSLATCSESNKNDF